MDGKTITPPHDANTDAKRKVEHEGKAAGQQVREGGREAGAAVREKGREASDRLRAASDETRHRIRETADQWKDQGRSMLSQRKDWAAGELDHITGAVRQAADKLHEENDERMASYAEAMADRVDGVARYVRERDVDAIVDDAGCVVRERPAWVLGGLFVTGLIAARFLKASSPPRRAEQGMRGRPSRAYGSATPPPDPEIHVNTPLAPTPPTNPAATGPASASRPQGGSGTPTGISTPGATARRTP